MSHVHNHPSMSPLTSLTGILKKTTGVVWPVRTGRSSQVCLLHVGVPLALLKIFIIGVEILLKALDVDAL